MALLEEGFLRTSSRHRIYFRVEGSQDLDAVPVFIFHGGWGPRDSDRECAATAPNVRVVQMHQRGWGNSSPAGELTDNNPAQILRDVEDLRRHLGIDRWLVVGGSTGAMLALLYAVENASAVSGVLLRGTWLLRRKEIDWCYRGGMAHFYPQEWQDFCAHVGCDSSLSEGHADPVALFGDLLHSQDEGLALAAAQAWMRWDAICGELVPDLSKQGLLDPAFALTAARIGVYFYLQQDELLPDDHILEKARLGALQGVPVRLVNGRYDLLCPPKWTHEVAQALRCGGADCTVTFVDANGHAGTEEGIQLAMQRAVLALSLSSSQSKVQRPEPKEGPRPRL